MMMSTTIVMATNTKYEKEYEESTNITREI